MNLPQNNRLRFSDVESNGLLSSEQTTRCVLLTGAGRSAIAVIELWGARADECIQTLFRSGHRRPLKVAEVRFGVWLGRQMAVDQPSEGESIVVVPTPAQPQQTPAQPQQTPAQPQPTTTQRYEIHCHGGEAAIERIMHDLAAMGVIRVTPGALSGVPFQCLHSSGDQTDNVLISEACEVLIECTTARTAAIALDQVRGALWNWCEQSVHAMSEDLSDSAEIAEQAKTIAVSGRIGIRLTRPFDVVLAGPPNVGKSSLINAMVGYDRSITMDLAGTTRDVLDAETVFDGWPLRLRDTAGLHLSEQEIEKQGIRRALQAIAGADLVVKVTEPGLEWDRKMLDVIGSVDRSVPVLHVINKFDLSPTPNVDALTTVATTGQGIHELLQEVIKTVQADVPPIGSPVPVTQRQLDWVNQIASLADRPKELLDALRSL